ncbi:hypothetical protein [Sphingomonas sp.]|jgi:hypothetical protein|nr:hypothetical protein [Sphingomonas sp.]HEU0044836.1 hypothetical protein [Sphingomonas sp.]
MKAMIFALIVLLGIDLIAYEGVHVQDLWATLASFGRGVGAWVFYTG